MSDALRVVSLQAHNVLRLTAVDLTWDKDISTLTIGGRNGAGKSSVLNSVAMALGGAALCPDEPIRRGESEGFVEVNLGELIVRRDFYKERLACDKNCVEGAEASDGGLVHFEGCAAKLFGGAKSKLTVRNAEGIKLGTPQAILDKLIGTLTFDPLAFAMLGNEGADGEKRQAEILRRVVGLDTADVDSKRKAAAERRAHFNKEHKAAQARLDAMPVHSDAPADEVPMSAIADEMRKAEEYRTLADEADRAVDASSERLQKLESSCQTRYARIEELNKQVAALQAELDPLEANFTKETKDLDALKITAQAARVVVPDLEAIRKKLTDVEATNAKVRVNAERKKAAAGVAELAAKAQFEQGYVEAADAEKEQMLKAVAFPVEGLGVGEDGVTFGGISLKQASTSEQIRVSVAVGFALNPGLKLLLVRNGNALDEDALKAVAAQAQAAGGQILCEYVTKDASEVSVMIEDGHVA